MVGDTWAETVPAVTIEMAAVAIINMRIFIIFTCLFLNNGSENNFFRDLIPKKLCLLPGTDGTNIFIPRQNPVPQCC